MNVFYILHSTGPNEGSTKAFISLLAKVQERGIKPTVVLPNTDGIYDTLKKEGIDVVCLNYRLATYPPVKNVKDAVLWLPRLLGRICTNSKASKQLAKIGSEKGCQIIHTNVSVTNIGYKAAKLMNIPHVWHIREYGDLIGYHYIFTRSQQLNNYKTPKSYTVCITKGIQKHHGLQGYANSRVIYDGAIKAKNAHNELGNEQKFFLYAGRLERAKGIEDLLNAYAEYKKRCNAPLPLYIAGDTSVTGYKEHLKNIIKEYGIEADTVFLGMRDDINDFYKQAKAVIMCSPNEGFGLVTAESMNAGCLVIGLDTTGTKEQFDNGKEFCGEEIGIRYNNQQELIEHLIEVTNSSPQVFAKMKENAQKTVTQLYTDEVNAAQIVQFYKEIEKAEK